MLFTNKILKPCAILKRMLSYNPSEILSQSNRENCMKKFRSMSIKQGSKKIVRSAAVLIPLYVKNNELSLLYTLRAATLRSHRGQISFPGGMIDSSDKSIEYAALRETKEELGINPRDVEIWGCGNPIIRQELAITPVIGVLKPNLPLNNLKVNYKEVAEVFTVRVEDLVNPKYHKHTQFRGSYSTPTYLGGPYRIWGLTAVITFMFLKALLSPEAYAHQIRYIPDISQVLSQHR